ncbi:alpha-galactosidase [Asticcacaulis sp. AC460]|uniref:glycoside hydrolase family 27 protein n=1 Tax=Asticcacaulis sp. AC460 TaxID=1282360 RepID=UPI0003C3EAC9|nr:glycoside hydrolase family 27 protein [Asticcacaulis sp. AC460]ESQ93497.1 alpha-galactosidase [Asticcacaulis sp. AC460]
MSSFSPSRRAILAGSALAGMAATLPAGASAQTTGLLAPTPPMGWNSWNSFATTITEDQSLEVATIMAQKLLPSGYDIFTVDIQWYEPEAKSYAYNAEPVPTMDDHGRLLPAPNRFPSSANGKGFKPLADKVHAMGLRFGVHLMRGIPRLAVKKNVPIVGTSVRAADIADTSSTCPWNPDMYGVDMSKPGAQAYYDSVFKLFASWGVDFVKMDDMSRPYDAHMAEIEAAHLAIQNSGRPMLLSLSPGETPVARGEHVRRFAQMWRISDDFWDEWKLLDDQFTRFENWNAWRQPGAWPDGDMLPLGRLALGDRDTKFTPDEQQTLMSLWSIVRSPLIMGGDLRHLDQATLDLLTNPEVLAVNQNSKDNGPHFLADGTRVWTARAGDNNHLYVALFNTTGDRKTVSFALKYAGANGRYKVRDLWKRADIGTAEGKVQAEIPAHGSVLYRLSAA